MNAKAKELLKAAREQKAKAKLSETAAVATIPISTELEAVSLSSNRVGRYNFNLDLPSNHDHNTQERIKNHSNRPTNTTNREFRNESSISHNVDIKQEEVDQDRKHVIIDNNNPELDPDNNEIRQDIKISNENKIKDDKENSEKRREKSPTRMSDKLAMFEQKSQVVDNKASESKYTMGKLSSNMTTKIQANMRPLMTGGALEEIPMQNRNHHGGSVNRGPIKLSGINRDEPLEVKLVASSAAQKVINTNDSNSCEHTADITTCNLGHKHDNTGTQLAEIKEESISQQMDISQNIVNESLLTNEKKSALKEKLNKKLASAKGMLRANTKEPDKMAKQPSEKILSMAGMLGNRITMQNNAEKEINKMLTNNRNIDFSDKKRNFLKNDSDIQQIEEPNDDESIGSEITKKFIDKDINIILNERPVRQVRKKKIPEFSG